MDQYTNTFIASSRRKVHEVTITVYKPLTQCNFPRYQNTRGHIIPLITVFEPLQALFTHSSPSAKVRCKAKIVARFDRQTKHHHLEFAGLNRNKMWCSVAPTALVVEIIILASITKVRTVRILRAWEPKETAPPGVLHALRKVLIATNLDVRDRPSSRRHGLLEMPLR